MKAIERLEIFMESKGDSRPYIERKCGIHQGYLSTKCKRKYDIGEDLLEKILQVYPDLNLVWLMTGEGDMYISEEEVNTKSILKSIIGAVSRMSDANPEYKPLADFLLNFVKESGVDL